jgi:hypothetical protein
LLTLVYVEVLSGVFCYVGCDLNSPSIIARKAGNRPLLRFRVTLGQANQSRSSAKLNSTSMTAVRPDPRCSPPGPPLSRASGPRQASDNGSMASRCAIVRFHSLRGSGASCFQVARTRGTMWVVQELPQNAENGCNRSTVVECHYSGLRHWPSPLPVRETRPVRLIPAGATTLAVPDGRQLEISSPLDAAELCTTSPSFGTKSRPCRLVIREWFTRP